MNYVIEIKGEKWELIYIVKYLQEPFPGIFLILFSLQPATTVKLPSEYSEFVGLFHECLQASWEIYFRRNFLEGPAWPYGFMFLHIFVNMDIDRWQV